MPNTFLKGLPFLVSGTVVKGFGRGSKELGIPTANFNEIVVDKLPKEVNCGIYFGWASVNNGQVYKMVMSVGWNPYFKNEKKSMVCETHIIHQFEKDFYGSLLKVAILGFIRPEKDFSSIDDLIKAIKCDIQLADKALEQPQYKLFENHPFFSVNENNHSI